MGKDSFAPGKLPSLQSACWTHEDDDGGATSNRMATDFSRCYASCLHLKLPIADQLHRCAHTSHLPALEAQSSRNTTDNSLQVT